MSSTGLFFGWVPKWQNFAEPKKKRKAEVCDIVVKNLPNPKKKREEVGGSLTEIMILSGVLCPALCCCCCGGSIH
jgi:hypothetical protein